MVNRDTTFCANKNCKDKNCIRNCNVVKRDSQYSGAMFTECEKWDDAGARWLTSQLESWPEFVEMRDKLMSEKN